MLIEVSVDGNRTLVNMDTVIGITENGDDATDIYTSTGVIEAAIPYDEFVKFLDPDNRKIQRSTNG